MTDTVLNEPVSTETIVEDTDTLPNQNESATEAETLAQCPEENSQLTTENTETYTNEYLLNFNLHYLASWEITTQTRPFANTNVVGWEILLRKGPHTVTFKTRPESLSGCDDLSTPLFANSGITHNEGYQEFVPKEDPSSYQYGQQPDCDLDIILTSNIKHREVEGLYSSPLPELLLL